MQDSAGSDCCGVDSGGPRSDPDVNNPMVNTIKTTDGLRDSEFRGTQIQNTKKSIIQTNTESEGCGCSPVTCTVGKGKVTLAGDLHDS